MTDLSQITEKISKHWAVVLPTTIIVLSSGIWWAIEETVQLPHYFSVVPTVLILYVLMSIVIYSVLKLLDENKRYKSTFDLFHEINHVYRQALAGSTAKLLSINSSERQKINEILLTAERDTLNSVVRLVSSIFNRLTNRDTTTTIWLYDTVTRQCSEYISCKDNISSQRERNTRKSYDFNDNDFLAKCVHKEGKCCHFFDSNLKKARKLRKYADQRPNNDQIYQAILTVPIRYVNDGQEHIIGYLQIDQKSANHLNNVEHLFILAACADQMYNFFSIIRKNFLFN